jgi:hypothetical protein
MLEVFAAVRGLITRGFGEELGRVAEDFFGLICLIIMSDYESEKVRMTRTLLWQTASHPWRLHKVA